MEEGRQTENDEEEGGNRRSGREEMVCVGNMRERHRGETKGSNDDRCKSAVRYLHTLRWKYGAGNANQGVDEGDKVSDMIKHLH